MDILLTLIVMFILLLLQGFFSGSEIALVNADKLKLRHRARQGHSGSKLVLKQFEKPERLLTTTLVGTNIATVSLTTLGTVMMIRHIGEGGDFLAVILLVPIMLIFGEVVPKSVYQQKSDLLAPIIIYPLQFFSWILFPVILLFSSLAKLAAKMVAQKQKGSDLFVSREKIRTLLDSAEQAPSSDIFDQQRIRHALRYSDLKAIDVMIPLSDAVIMNSEHTLDKAIQIVIRTGYSRLPVYDTEASRVIGILVITTWDLLDPEIKSHSLHDYIRPAKFVAPSQPTEKLLAELQKREDHMAIVVDEFGSAIGLLTAEDIMEEVVGEIEDIDFRLHHNSHTLFELIGDREYLVDAHMPINDINELLNINIPIREFRTVGGMLVHRLEKIPTMDESVIESGYQFIVQECDERMVKKIKVVPD
ncbi:MAG: hemolysin family protein [Gammaproteobacteria bacterium]|nr:hemolysin family protein [Gammaproteobacteria bacterium]